MPTLFVRGDDPTCNGWCELSSLFVYIWVLRKSGHIRLWIAIFSLLSSLFASWTLNLRLWQLCYVMLSSLTPLILSFVLLILADIARRFAIHFIFVIHSPSAIWILIHWCNLTDVHVHFPFPFMAHTCNNDDDWCNLVIKRGVKYSTFRCNFFREDHVILHK